MSGRLAVGDGGASDVGEQVVYATDEEVERALVGKATLGDLLVHRAHNSLWTQDGPGTDRGQRLVQLDMRACATDCTG
jgi:hypothetical protein